MSPRRQALALRRAMLQQRSTELRRVVADQAQLLRPALRGADAVRSGWQWLQEHPAWVAGAAALLFATGPVRAVRFVGRWSLRAWSLWRWAQRVRTALPPLWAALDRGAGDARRRG
jgi:hypothetical protein